MENFKIEIKEAENHLPNHQPLISESIFKYDENKLLGIDDSDALVCECLCVCVFGKEWRQHHWSAFWIILQCCLCESSSSPSPYTATTLTFMNICMAFGFATVTRYMI